MSNDTSSDTQDVSTYLAYLPAVFSGTGPAGDGPGANFLGRFLLAFERILTGLGERELPAGVAEKIPPGLEEILEGVVDAQGATRLAGIQRFFDPGPCKPDGKCKPDGERTPEGFLPWLAGWLALNLRADWPPDKQREFISQIASLYRLRGTKAGLRQLLEIHTGMKDMVTIYEFHEPLQVGDGALAGTRGGAGSTVGVDTVIGSAAPHYFLVRMVFPPSEDVAGLERTKQIARTIIDQEKPAQAWYDLQVESPAIKVGVRSTIGIDTLLGTPSWEAEDGR